MQQTLSPEALEKKPRLSQVYPESRSEPVIKLTAALIAAVYKKMRSRRNQNADYRAFSGQFSPSVIHIFSEICHGHHRCTKPTAHCKG